MKRFSILVASCCLASFVSASHACTIAFSNTNPIAKTVARSMDLFISDEPTLVVYPRGMLRTGNTEGNTAEWTSLYGSVVITAFHTDVASDGMNEHGLSAHMLYLDNSVYEKATDDTPTLSNTLWAQYMLDNFKTVSEAVAGMQDIRLVPTEVHGRTWPIHLSLEDPSGDSAIIEFIDGKMTVHQGSQYTVMTNEPAYDIQLANLKKYKLFGGKLALPGDVDPLSRFVRVSSFLKTLPQPSNQIEAIAYIASVIRTAMVPFGAEDTSGSQTTDSWPTRWITLSDMTNKTYYFSSTSAPNIIWVDLNKFKFEAGTAVFQIDPTNVSLVGEITDPRE